MFAVMISYYLQDIKLQVYHLRNVDVTNNSNIILNHRNTKNLVINNNNIQYIIKHSTTFLFKS